MIKILVFDLDDKLFPEHKFVRSGFKAVGAWMLNEYSVADFFEVAWQFFEQGKRGKIFNLTLKQLGMADEPLIIEKMLQNILENCFESQKSKVCFSSLVVSVTLIVVSPSAIHLYHDRLVGFIGNQEVVQLPRVYAKTNTSKRRARSVNYRHVIHSLGRKPRAFLGYRWREELLPNESDRRLWRNLQEQFSPDQACRLMVECLYIAAVQDKEYLVSLWVERQLREQTLTLIRLQQNCCCVPTQTCFDTFTVQQHSLAHYDQLLHHDFSRHDRSDFTDAAQSPPTAPHAAAMAVPRS
ncbi:hypothetical protein IQ238_03645 [Pleurocapsales cyanobacterium LEGE 06147]|nr:hypothetical protein [Pleurocapsales cyanobacterium LEGE 06147]